MESNILLLNILWKFLLERGTRCSEIFYMHVWVYCQGKYLFFPPSDRTMFFFINRLEKTSIIWGRWGWGSRFVYFFKIERSVVLAFTSNSSSSLPFTSSFGPLSSWWAFKLQVEYMRIKYSKSERSEQPSHNSWTFFQSCTVSQFSSLCECEFAISKFGSCSALSRSFIFPPTFGDPRVPTSRSMRQEMLR